MNLPSPRPQGLLDKTFVYEREMEDGKEVLGEAANFFDVPIAAVSNLSKLQTTSRTQVNLKPSSLPASRARATSSRT